jgi:hypothetical protein
MAGVLTMTCAYARTLGATQVELAVGPSSQCRLCSAIKDYNAGLTADVDKFRISWEYLTKDDQLEAMQRAVMHWITAS